MAPIGPTPIEPPERRPRRASRRIKVTLPESLAQKLDKLASRAGEPPAKVAAHMIRQAVADAEEDGSGDRQTHPRRRQAQRRSVVRARRPPAYGSLLNTLDILPGSLVHTCLRDSRHADLLGLNECPVRTGCGGPADTHARDQLGQEGQDPDRITRLAERMSQSQEHTPSIAYQETPDPAWDPTRDPLRTDELIPHMDWLNREQERDTRDLEMDIGLER